MTAERRALDETALYEALDAQLPSAVDLRHALHADPRLSGDEADTLRLLRDALPPESDAEEVRENGAILSYGGDGPSVAIRAELDALPIVEATGVEWASLNDAMHACGHDVHMAALVAVVRALRAGERPLPVQAILQPREESYPSGALDMLGSRTFREGRVQAVIGAHVQPLLGAGEVSCSAGVVNAAADEFTVRITGREGHAAYPHLTVDPLLAASQLVVAAQQIVSRNVDPMTPAVLAVGALQAGTISNVVPGEAVISGTLRALHPATRDLLHRRLKEVVNGVVAASGCTCEMTISKGEPALTNAPLLAEGARLRLDKLTMLSSSEIRSCGADDFAYYSENVASLMMFVGTRATGQLHSRTFLPGDEAVGTVARALLSGYLSARDVLRRELTPETAAVRC